jgi:hypothetical protein
MGDGPGYLKAGGDSEVTGVASPTNLLAMLALAKTILGALVAGVRPRASLVLENLALRQQLAVLRRATPRPRLRPIDRAFWAVLSRA